MGTVSLDQKEKTSFSCLGPPPPLRHLCTSAPAVNPQSCWATSCLHGKAGGGPAPGLRGPCADIYTLEPRVAPACRVTLCVCWGRPLGQCLPGWDQTLGLRHTGVHLCWLSVCPMQLLQ